MDCCKQFVPLTQGTLHSHSHNPCQNHRLHIKHECSFGVWKEKPIIQLSLFLMAMRRGLIWFRKSFFFYGSLENKDFDPQPQETLSWWIRGQSCLIQCDFHCINYVLLCVIDNLQAFECVPQFSSEIHTHLSHPRFNMSRLWRQKCTAWGFITSFAN